MFTAPDDFNTGIRSVIAQHGRLSTDAKAIATDADLYKAGMTSHATVNVMLGLEGTFDVEFPDQFLNRSVFTSIDTIRDALVTIAQSSARS